MRLLLLGGPIDAEEALRLGFVELLAGGGVLHERTEGLNVQILIEAILRPAKTGRVEEVL